VLLGEGGWHGHVCIRDVMVLCFGIEGLGWGGPSETVAFFFILFLLSKPEPRKGSGFVVLSLVILC
jgi:hypothetical protein